MAYPRPDLSILEPLHDYDLRKPNPAFRESAESAHFSRRRGDDGVRP